MDKEAIQNLDLMEVKDDKAGEQQIEEEHGDE